MRVLRGSRHQRTLIVGYADVLMALYQYVYAQAPLIDARNERDEPIHGQQEREVTPDLCLVRGIMDQYSKRAHEWEAIYESRCADPTSHPFFFMDMHQVPQTCVMPAIRHLVILDSVASADFYMGKRMDTMMRLDDLLVTRASRRHPLHVTRFNTPGTLEETMYKDLATNARGLALTSRTGWPALNLPDVVYDECVCTRLTDIEMQRSEHIEFPCTGTVS
jgi:hypothetical protein